MTNKKPWTIGDAVVEMWNLDERGKPYSQAKQDDENLVSIELATFKLPL